MYVHKGTAVEALRHLLSTSFAALLLAIALQAVTPVNAHAQDNDEERGDLLKRKWAERREINEEVPPGPYIYTEHPFIERLTPSEGRCGSQITLRVYGGFFHPNVSVNITEGVETIETAFLNGKTIEVTVFIAPDAPPGPRRVELLQEGDGVRVVDVLENGFLVIPIMERPTRPIPEPPLPRPAPAPPRPSPEPPVPASPEGEGPDYGWLVPVLALVAAAVVVVLTVVAGVTLTVLRSVKINRRKDWQRKAEEEEPPETCRHCTLYCREIELKLEPALRKVAYLNLSAERPGSGGQAEERRVAGDIVDGLSEAVAARRRREKPETLQRRVEPIALSLLQLIAEWLRGEPAPRDVRIVGHIVGGKAECQFVLYHCKRRGDVNVWEEEDKWKATVEDERDEAVGALPGLAPAEPSTPERLAGELARMLMRFIEKV